MSAVELKQQMEVKALIKRAKEKANMEDTEFLLSLLPRNAKNDMIICLHMAHKLVSETKYMDMLISKEEIQQYIGMLK